MASVKECGVKPFRWWIERNWISPVPLDRVPLLNDHVWEAYYDNDVEHRKRTSRMVVERAENVHPFPEVFRKLRTSESEWSERLGYKVVDDWSMHGGGLHALDPGGWLSCHLDYAAHPHLVGKERRLNLIAFLNPEWKKEWGGALQLCNPMGEPVKEIYPEPGMLVAFETGDESYHGVSKIVGPVPRITAAVYFLSDLRPGVTRQRALFIPNRGGM